MEFKKLLEFYGFKEEDAEKIRRLIPYLSEEDKKIIAEETKSFVFKHLPRSAKLLEELGVKGAFSGTIEKFITKILNFEDEFFAYVETVAKTHISASISPEDFLKDYAQFSKLLFDRLNPPPELAESLKNLAFVILLVAVFIGLSFIEKAESLREYDPVTGLTAKIKLVRETLDIAENSRSLILLDIDGFKELNLNLGYGAGNSVLAIFSSHLRLRFPASYITRLQNDEFFIATPLPVGDARKELFSIQRQLIEQPIEVPTPYGTERLRIEFKAVILNAKLFSSSSSSSSSSFDILMWILYNGLKKTFAEEKIKIISKKEFDEFISNRALLLELLFALSTKNVKLARQKVVNVFTGKLLFYEVLARIVTKEGKLISPGCFISLIEDTNLERKLDRTVVSKLFDYISRNEGEEKYSVNLSTAFMRDDFYWFLTKLEEYKIPPERVIVEITERGDIFELPGIEEKMKLLRERGIKVFLDDYGVKFSNYSTLRKLEVSGIKIDGSIVAEIGNNPCDALFIDSVMKFARMRDLFVVAEYIENGNQLEKIKSLAEEDKFPIMYGQGFYWHKPEIFV